MVALQTSLLALLAARSAFAAPIPSPFLGDLVDSITDGAKDLVRGVKQLINPDDANAPNSTSVVSQAEINELVPFANWARASFCSEPVVLAWECGEACDANPETRPIIAGGDDGRIPGFFVAFDPPTNAVVVAHQGTNRQNALSVINSIDLFLDDPIEARFPGADAAGVQIHGGFQDSFERTASQVVDAVRKGLEENGANKIFITGHSLGGAISLLEAISLRKVFPNVEMKTVLFGLPRAGNKEFADYVDATLAGTSFQYVVNGADPVPKVPPVELGFEHPTGELFQVVESVNADGLSVVGQTLRCEGRENVACNTNISLVDSDADTHDGPYLGIPLGSKFCTI